MIGRVVVLGLSVLMLHCGEAAARAKPPAAPAPAPAYCPDAGTLAQIGGAPADVVAQVRQTCKPGSSVTFPSFATGVIMMACDPGKPMTPIGRDIACTLKP